MLLKLGQRVIKFCISKIVFEIQLIEIWVTEVHPVYWGTLNLHRDEMLPRNCHFRHVPCLAPCLVLVYDK